MDNVKSSNKLAKRTLMMFLLFGTVGQIAWCIENSFLNLYVNRTISTNLMAVSAMVASSAVVATLTTIIMGWLIDRSGKRRPFMVYGYILWGISVMLFSVFTKDNMRALGMSATTAVVVASVGMVIMDCVMTFFGSTSNDAAFNAYVTDNTSSENRGRIEALLSVLAVVAYLLVFVPFEMTGITQNKYFDAAGNSLPTLNGADSSKTITGNWTLFYCVLGGVVILAGIIGFFALRSKSELTLTKDMSAKQKFKKLFAFEQDMPVDKKLKFKDLFYGFRPSVIKRNKYLYLVLATVMIAYIANNCFSNFTAIYLQNTLEADKHIPVLGYLLPWGLSMGLAFVAGIIAGVLLDKTKKNKTVLIIPGIAASCLGSLMMYFTSPDFIQNNVVAVLSCYCVGSFIQSMGSSIIGVVCLSSVRNLTPPDKTGRFQGIRMVFVVMMPMVVGSIVSGAVSSSDRFIAGVDEFGNATYTCPPIMFLLAAIVVLLAIVPTIFLLKAKSEDLITPAEGLEPAAINADNDNSAANDVNDSESARLDAEAAADLSQSDIPEQNAENTRDNEPDIATMDKAAPTSTDDITPASADDEEQPDAPASSDENAQANAPAE